MESSLNRSEEEEDETHLAAELQQSLRFSKEAENDIITINKSLQGKWYYRVLNNKTSEVKLSFRRLGDEGCQQVAAALAAHPTSTSPPVHSLHLLHNGIRDRGAQALANVIPVLQHLNLWWNDIGEQGVRAIATAAASSSSKLRWLDLGRNPMGNPGAQALASAFLGSSSSSALLTLRLDSCGIEAQGVQALASALLSTSSTCCCALQVLVLSGNNVGDDGAIALATTLTSTSSLTEMRLDGCRIGDVGAMALADALGKNNNNNNNLDTLTLDSNALTDACASHWATALLYNTTLSILDLKHNPQLTAAAKAVIAQSLRYNPQRVATWLLQSAAAAADRIDDVSLLWNAMRYNVTISPHALFGMKDELFLDLATNTRRRRRTGAAHCHEST